MLFPMYTLAVEKLLEMTQMEPHEQLKERGDIILFDGSIGNAAFVSHQWVSKGHPDPDLKQMRVLQDAVKHFLSGNGFISLDVVTESLMQSAKGIPFQEFRAKVLFFWYDYFSVPQTDRCEQTKAINSIHAYVEQCRYFFALCPTIECHFEGRMLNVTTWSTRGWCRLERAARELSEHDTWILVRSSTSVEVVGAAVSGSVGEGEFTVESDRAKLAPVMKAIVQRKLMLSLKAGDFPAYRRHLNLQAVHLRGLEIEPVSDLVPGISGADMPGMVAHFFRQNGLTKVSRRDAAGWWPLHYAAFSGNVQLIEGLLQQRADPNCRTTRDEAKLGFPPWASALDIAVRYRHNEAAQLLIAFRAEVHGGMVPAVQFAAIADNAEGIGLLCAAGGDAMARTALGPNGLEAAAGYGALKAVEELVRQGRPDHLELSEALRAAMVLGGGSAELVKRLVDLRADVDFQYDIYRGLTLMGRLVYAAKSLQHRLGRKTSFSALAYHAHGQTPLMAAMQSAQHEGAAALIALNASLEMRNCRAWRAADFVQGQAIPEFLQQALEGNPAECQKLLNSHFVVAEAL
ncbi:unnamed protein product [Symbiodinium natans]|uniref:Uncharacterized protein n=1 Tax=Symbiodinium natans TaxID=878477 RepID=A0A812JAB0_9DINO|nr:unnamed protein product [Symbiodinium natans]